ncbi:Uncharacterized protein APZ42_026708 [Daphnia magna]|uniref:Uncharacterized protein n=1 Tax=Daphnia magna TaxID=35525 RepID=A0A164S133_9CRUS|nr:Uncharacterized protein APZ42_026708 [Daphnia magna]
MANNIQPGADAEEEEDVEYGVELAAMKTKRTTLRRQIMVTSRKKDSLTSSRGSQGAIQGLLLHLNDLLLRTLQLQTEITSIEAEEEEAERQDATHLTYITHAARPEEDHFTSVSQQIDNTTPQSKALLDRQRQKKSYNYKETPDTWVDLYSAGRLPPAVAVHSTRSLVSAELESFDGEALEWFSWIDLFRALEVESRRISKLLKQTCGRRDVMRAAHHQAIQRLETKQDPALFKRFAQRIRTHSFDLSRIVETRMKDLIEKIYLKLHLPDRLAWNEERRERIEDRSLNAFEMWLCSLGSVYQNAFSIAADQINPNSSKPTDQRRQARTHQSSAKMSGEQKQVAFRLPGKPFCFKYFHHPLLHDTDKEKPSTEREGRARPTTARAGAPRKVTMGMLRLPVIADDGSWVLANIFVDEDSDSTLMRSAFGTALKLRGPHQILAVDEAGGIINRYPSARVQFRVRAVDGNIFSLEGSTMNTVASPTLVTDWNTE